MKKKNYLSNANLLEMLRRWKESGEEQLSDELALAFMLLCKKIQNHRWFKRYPKELKEDMMSEALINLVRSAKNFDPDKGTNPFAYFSQYVFNAYKGVSGTEYHAKACASSWFLDNVETIDIEDSGTLAVIEQDQAYYNSVKAKRERMKQKKNKPQLFGQDEEE